MKKVRSLNTRELSRIVSRRIGAPAEYTEDFANAVFDCLVECLEQGNDLSIRGLGTFYWTPAAARTLQVWTTKKERVYVHHPEGLKLKFLPSTKLRRRRRKMSDTEFTKYGVELDDEKEKQAAKNKEGVAICPICSKVLDSGGACPEHGTKPFEKR
jgi:nucleoid DNA-binding protein